MTISRTRFYKWLIQYGSYITNKQPLEGRDMNGRWFEMQTPKSSQSTMNL
jgi:hypothetical protein